MAEKQPEFEESGRYPFDDMEEPAQSPVSAVRNAALIEEIVLDCTASEREIYFAHLRQIAEQEPEIYRRLQIYEKEEPKPSRQDRATMNRIDAKIMRRLYRQHMEYSQIMRCISYSPAYKTLSAEFRWILASTRVAREINPILLSPDLVSAEPIYRIDRKTIRDEPDKAYCSYLKAVLEQKPSMDLKEADEKIAEALRRMHIPDAEIRQCMSYSVGKEQEEAPREQYQFVQIRNPEKLTQKRLEDCLKTLHTGKPSPEVELAAGKLILEVRGLNEARRQDISTQSENLKLWQCFNVYVEQLEACKENLSNGPKIIQALKEAQEYLSAQKNELLRFFPKYQQELAERDSRQKPAEIFRKIEKEGIDPKAEPNLTPPQRKIEPLAQERPQPEEESKDQDLYQAMQKTIRGMEKTDLAAYWKQVHQTIEQTMLAVNQAKIAYKVLAIWEIGLEKSCKDFHMDMDQNLKELSQKLRQTLQNEEERWQLICQMAGKASQFSEKLMAFAKLEQSAPQLTREEFLHAKKFAKLQPSAPARELYYAAVRDVAQKQPETLETFADIDREAIRALQAIQCTPEKIKECMQYSPLQEKQREARGQKAADWRKAPEVQAASSVAGLKPQHTSHEIYYAYLKEAVEKEPHSSIEKANEQAAKAMLRDKRPIRQIRECLLCAPNVKALPNTFKQKEAVEKLMKTIQKEKKNDQNHELSR